MDNQHKKISGYRDLTEEEINMMNAAKALEAEVGALFRRMMADPNTDKRHLALARTNIQQGFMWMVRGVAQPVDSFED